MDARGKLVGNYSCGACHGAAEYEAPVRAGSFPSG
jgi:hypothetical protein